MEQVKLRPNDRVAIGPSAIFIYKNKAHDDEASRPDTDADPITFDLADNEIIEAEEAEGENDLAKSNEELKKEQEASAKAAIDDLNKHMEEEEDAQKEEIAELEKEAGTKENGTEEEKQSAEQIKATIAKRKSELEDHIKQKI